jgi:FtsP/CotA-like multicopper oxidase with cupredoxin domain
MASPRPYIGGMFSKRLTNALWGPPLGLPSAFPRARLLIVSINRRRGAGTGALRLLAGALTALATLSAGAQGRVSDATGPAALENAYPVEIQPNGVVREFTIRAAPTRLPLIGLERVEVWAYNGQVPGPTLRLRLGETLRVRFHNDLPQPTTIHWHGVRVPNAMDGVPGVTQPPVPPGGEFVYEFTPKDAGTFWFHPHLRASEQVERGLFGVLVVEDASPPPFSRELVLVLDDWLLGRDLQIDPRFNTARDLSHDGRWGNYITVNGERRPRFEVQYGERLRLRLINVANGRVFAPDFGGLDPRVIAVDGLYAARPLDLSSLELAPGNRVDLDLTVPAAQANGPWLVHDVFTERHTRYSIAELRKTPNALPPSFDEQAALARVPPIPLFSLSARPGDAVASAHFESPARAHVPVWPDAAARPLRAEFELNARRGGEYGLQWTINDQAFDHPAHQGTGGDLAVLPHGEWSKLRFVNKSPRLHPMHLHGTFFKLLTRNGTAADEPFFRDTVLIRQHETIEIGLVPVDKGRWMMHCHILEHAESGMMALLRVE